MPSAELSLGADPQSAGAARRFLAATLISWNSTEYGEDAVLLLSELVANAALHARTQIGVRVELRPDCLRLSVTDGSPQQPLVRHYSDEATTGRGLALVGALARRWGVEGTADGTKTVWAEVAAEPVRAKAHVKVVDKRVSAASREAAGRTAPEGVSESLNASGDDPTSHLRVA